MADSILGLLFEINADPSKAQDALQKFEQSTGKSFERAAAGTKPLHTSLLNNRESLRLFSEELSLHMPRAVSGAVAKMLPGINAIGPALLGAFAIAEIPKFIKGVKDASEALGGYTKVVRDAEKADIDASTAALIHFTTIAQGSILIAQTNQALANLAAKQGNWQEEAKAADKAMTDSKSLLTSLLGPIGSVITLYRGYKAAVKETSDTESQAAQLRQRLGEQLDRMAHLQDDRHKEEAKTAKDAARAQEEADRAAERNAERRVATEQRMAMQRIRTMQEAGKEVEKLRKAEEAEAATKDRIAKADLDFTLRLEEMGIVEQRRIQGFDKLIPQVTAATNVTVHLSAARRVLIGITQEAREAEQQWTQALRDEVQSVAQNVIGTVEGINEQFAQLIGGTKAVAAVRGAWDVAKSVECWAAFIESHFTDWPSALAAVQYDLSAAEMFKVAGSGGHRASRPGGGGSYSGGGGESGHGTGDMGYGPQTLAPGAAGSGGRFSGTAHVVVFGTDHELQNWVAGAVNRAVHRGVTVQATTSQRGAPVGH